MKNLTPQGMASKWAAAMAAAGPAYTAGTANPRVNPMQAAATPEAMQAWINGVTASQQKRIAKLNSTPLSKYVQGCAQKGAANLATGARLATPQYTAAMGTWIPVYNQASAAAKAIQKVKGSFANASARANAALQVMMNAAQQNAGLAGGG